MAPVGPFKRAVFLLLAGLFFALAVVGVVLPIIPTTPFLLLCSYFLARSSPRLQAALMRSRLFGPLLRDWHDRGGVRTPVKIWAVACVTTVVGLTLWFSDLSIVARSGLVTLAAIGLVVVIRLPKARDAAPDAEAADLVELATAEEATLPLDPRPAAPATAPADVNTAAESA